MTIDELKGKNILILGFAREGRDTLKFLRKYFPNKIFGIADQKDSLLNLPAKKVKLYLGKSYLKDIRKYDVVIKSPGIPLRTIKPLLKKSQYLTSETDIFFSLCKGTIIGITGTKGKSTTASLIYSILKKDGKRVHLVGNIGKPALQFLLKQTPKDIFVFELSSFQLEHLTQSPYVAVLLNLYQEHLNHHGSFAAYTKAKANITNFQSIKDFLIYNANDKEVVKIAKKSKAQKISFQRKPVSTNSSFLAPVEPAVLVGKLFSVKNSKIQKAIKDFKPLPHRLENIGTYIGITFINDSLATIPEATIGALDTLGKTITTLIVGGFDRGVGTAKLAKRIEQSNITTLILFPTTGAAIFKSLKKKPKNAFFVANMKEAVKLAYLNTKKGSTCLLSPAAASFNLFSDYQDRGDQFKRFVKQYAK
jgi:UDP-N-acetylmuramoylalanine--D-glutamate ligase